MNIDAIVFGFGKRLTTGEQVLGNVRHDYRYTLYDSNGNEVNEPTNSHRRIHSNVASEWEVIRNPQTQPDTLLLRYSGDNFYFGKASRNWGTVEHMRVEILDKGTYKYIGAAKIGSGKSISENQVLQIDASQGITIDYSKGSDSLSAFPNNLDGLFDKFLSYLDGRRASWIFQLEKGTGEVYDSVSLSKADSLDLWKLSSNRLTWDGPEIRWSKNSGSSFTASGIRCIMALPNGDRYQVGTASMSSTIDKGDTPYFQNGDFQIGE